MYRLYIALLLLMILLPYGLWLIVQPRTYGNSIAHIYTRVSSTLHSGNAEFDQWYDPTAHLWRTDGPGKFRIYIRCPMHAVCSAAQAPDYRYVPLQSTPHWDQLMDANLVLLPAHHGSVHAAVLAGTRMLLYQVAVPGASAVQRQYWVDVRTGRIMLLIALVSGRRMSEERITTTIVPPHTLPIGFFQPPSTDGNPLSAAWDWMQGRIEQRR